MEARRVRQTTIIPILESKIKRGGLDMETCPVCDGEGIQLGTLGNITHYRCRDCGITFSSSVELKWDDETTEQVAEFLGLR